MIIAKITSTIFNINITSILFLIMVLSINILFSCTSMMRGNG